MSKYNYKSNNSEIQLIPYADLKLLVKESINPLRELTPTEKERLRESLLSEKCINSALILQGSLITGYTIVDGFSRWGLLPEVIKQCPEFNTLIPIILKSHLDENEVKLYALRNQISRRNFSPMETSEALLILQNTGLTKGEAVKELAKLTDSSVPTIYRNLNPNSAKKDVEKKRENRASTHLDKLSTSKLHKNSHGENLVSNNSSVEKINSSIEVNRDTNLGVRSVGSKISGLNNLIASELKTKQEEDNTRDRTPEELQKIEDRYSTTIDEKGKEVITYIPIASNELERLNNLKESTINEMRNDIDFYKETALYPEIMILLSSLDRRIKELS